MQHTLAFWIAYCIGVLCSYLDGCFQKEVLEDCGFAPWFLCYGALQGPALSPILQIEGFHFSYSDEAMDALKLAPETEAQQKQDRGTAGE